MIAAEALAYRRGWARDKMRETEMLGPIGHVSIKGGGGHPR